MSDVGINHTEEMERAYWEAWMACKEISPSIRNMEFAEFARWIDMIEKNRIEKVFKEDLKSCGFFDDEHPANHNEFGAF